jgi:hypothetical protein
MDVQLFNDKVVTLYGEPDFEGRTFTFINGEYNCDKFSALDFHD